MSSENNKQPNNPAFSVAKALPEIPLDAIKVAVESYPEVKVHLRRNTQKGTWASMPTFTMATQELVNVDEFLREKFGGGRYRVMPRDPQNELIEVVPPFFVEIPGAPKLDHPNKGFGPFRPGQISGPASGAHPMGGAGYGVPTWATMQAQRDSEIDPRDFFDQTPDAIAMEQVRELRTELRELRKQREEEKRETEKQQRVLDQAKLQLEKELQREQNRHEKELADLKLAAVERSMQAAQTARPPTIDWVGVLTATAPIATALIMTSKERQALSLNAQQESARQHATMLTTLATAKPDKNSLEDFIKLASFVAPFVTTFMESRSPGAIAKLTAAMADGQLQTISMVSQLMQQMNDNNDNPWMDVARQAIAGVQDVATRMAEVNAAPRVPQGRRPGALQASTPSQQAPVQLTAQSSPVDFANAIVAAPGVPAEFKTATWKRLYVLIHDLKADPRSTAVTIARHLQALDESNTLPAVFAEVFTDNGTLPSVPLKGVLSELPIAQLSPARLEQICAFFDDVVGPEDEDGDDNADDGDVEDDSSVPVGDPRENREPIFTQN